MIEFYIIIGAIALASWAFTALKDASAEGKVQRSLLNNFPAQAG